MKSRSAITIFRVIIVVNFISYSCVKEKPTAPEIQTTPITTITSSSAKSGGNITDDGGEPIIARGICWSDSYWPDITDNKTSDGKGTGTFTSSISGLVSGATYRVRAYATTRLGTVYGNEVVFSPIGAKYYFVKATTIYTTQNSAGFNPGTIATYRSSRTISTGNIAVYNDYQGTVKIRLYHPDAPGSVYATWTLTSGDDVYFNYSGQRLVLGNDWGIQIVFENNVSSHINFVGTVGTYGTK
jgi:hypothetical protein